MPDGTMYDDWRQVLGGAIEALATRPQKSRVDTLSMTSETPYSLADMLARRERIGRATSALDEALKEREGFGYNMAKALAAAPQRDGYGTWLSDFARAFGAGYSGVTDARANRALTRYNNEMNDLETALKFDKEMGKTQTQSQEQIIGYDNMPYGGGKGNNVNGGQGGGVVDYTALPDVKLHDLNVAAGSWATSRYDPLDKEQGWLTRQGTAFMPGRDYGLDKSNKTKQAKEYEKYETVAMQGMFDVLKALRPATDTDVLTALKSAGADPTMAPEVRDLRLTKTLNQELLKGGFQPVKNLKNWDQALDYLKKNRVWDPVAAASANEKTQSGDGQQPAGGTVYVDENGRQFVLKGN